MSTAPESSEPILCDIASNPVPEGTRAGYFLTLDKVRLRYALWPKGKGAHKGTICLVQGRSEFIEKYFETVQDFRERGFAVATFDWRGQGGSERLMEGSNLGYVDSFEDFWMDLKSFHTRILLPDCPPPYYLVGHSMGGLVSLIAGEHDRMMFDRMFLSAPMVSLEGMPLSMGSMSKLADGLVYVGAGRFPLARGQEADVSDENFPGNALTSDFARYMRSVNVLQARPDLKTGAPSIRWLAAAFKAMARADAHDFPGRVRVPVLMLAAARDQVVSTPAIEHLGLRMRTGRHAVIANARHELFMENDEIRAQVFAAFDAFITEQSPA